MDISVVIPLLNEQDSIEELNDWIVSVMQSNDLSYEILFIDDGSSDKSWDVIKNLRAKNSRVIGLKFSKNFGKSQALHAGFARAKGAVVITMDADLQDSPDEIPALYQMIKEQDYDIVSGWKKKRYDSFFAKNMPSKLFNWAARKISGLSLHDFNCGLKAYRNEVIKTIEVYGEMHRYIPVLAVNAGFNNIVEKVVIHQARKYGKTKFGMERFINGFLDLITIWFTSKFGKRPMHFFGLGGALAFLIGFFLTAYVLMDKLIALQSGVRQSLVTDNPLFYLALVMLIIGTQLFMGGFLAEMLSRNAPNRNKYEISERLGFE